MLSVKEQMVLKKCITRYLDLVFTQSNLKEINEYLLDETKDETTDVLNYDFDNYSLTILESKILISVSNKELTKRMKGNLTLDNSVLEIASLLDPTFNLLDLGKLPENQFHLRVGIGLFDSPSEWADKVIAIETEIDLENALGLVKAVLIFGLIAEALLLKALIEKENILPSFHYEETGLRS